MYARLYCFVLAVMAYSLAATTASADIMVYHPERDGWTNYGTAFVDDAILDFNAAGVDGKILKFPAGTYVFSKQITPQTGSIIMSEAGTHLKAKAGTGTTGLDDDDLIVLQGNGVTIKNIYLDRETQTRANVTGNGINLNGKSQVIIKEVTIEMQNACITNTSQLAVGDVIIDDCLLRFAKTQAINLSGTTITIKDCKISHTLGNGIQVSIYKLDSSYEQSKLWIVGNGIHKCNGNGVKLTGLDSGASSPEGVNADISHNIIEQTASNAVALYVCDNVIVSENDIRAAGTSVTPPSSGNFYDGTFGGWSFSSTPTGTNYGVHVDENNTKINIAGNTIRNNPGGGVHLGIASGNTSGPDQVTIGNNQIDGGTNAIYLQDAGGMGAIEGVLISGNKITNATYSIHQDGYANRVIITSNLITSSGLMELEGIPDNIISDNLEW